MNEIVKYHGLPPLEKKIIESMFALKVMEATDDQLKDAVSSSVTNAMYNLGVKTPLYGTPEFDNAIQERMILESRIRIDLKMHFQILTIEEIKNAFDLGSKGEFRTKPDEVLYLSPEKIYGWFKAYKFGVKREASKKLVEVIQREEKAKEITEEQKEKIVMIGLLSSFEAFKNTGEVTDYGNVKYDKLDQLGLIRFTVERKKEIYSLAEQHLKASKQDDRDFMKGLKEMRSETQNLIKAEAKQMALTIFFKDLVEMEVELKDLIEEKTK